LDGIIYQNDHKSHKFKIEYISDEIKVSIRSWLSGICYGIDRVKEDEDYFTYSATLEGFFERYNKKQPHQRKGIIGELLSHIIVINYFNEFRTTSVLFNKEENNVRKGFDIVIFDTISKSIWYTEVKSGECCEDKSACKLDKSECERRAIQKNSSLLHLAKRSINSTFSNLTRVTWESALLDVNITTERNARTEIKKLLQLDQTSLKENKNTLKKVILISVLYDENIEVELESIKGFYLDVEEASLFDDTIAISIQKKTYQALEKFLREEMKEV